MLPDVKSWLDALRLPAQVAFAVFLACLVLLALYGYGILTFQIFGDNTVDILIILAVIFGALTLVHFLNFLLAPLFETRKQSALANRRELRRQEAADRRAEHEQKVAASLDHLADEELRVIANALRKGSPSVYTWIHNSMTATLMSKGLMYTPGGTYHQDHYPFIIYDFAWKELLRRKDELIAKDDENQRREKEEERRRRRY